MKKDDKRKITCPECGEVNSVRIPEFLGAFTKFCEGCGIPLRFYIDGIRFEEDRKES